jgi:hypothetical protein
MGDEIEESIRSGEWKKYFDILIEQKEITDELLELLPALEFLFEQKMYQFSDEGTNFVIPSGDPFRRQTRWFRPSRAGWNIREEGLYRKTVKTLSTRLKRGIKTQVILSSSEPLSRVLDFTRSMRASLEDGTSWKCNYCQARNLAEDSTCKICGHQR